MLIVFFLTFTVFHQYNKNTEMSFHPRKMWLVVEFLGFLSGVSVSSQ